MKSLLIGLLVTVLTIIHGTAAVTMTAITETEWSHYHNVSSTATGFSSTIRAGGNVPGTTEYGVTNPGTLNATVDIGWWNWNTPYHFRVLNEPAGVCMELNGVRSPLYSADMQDVTGLVLGVYANFPFAGLEIDNLLLDNVSLTELSVIWGSGTVFNGYKFPIDNWTVFEGDITFINSSGIDGFGPGFIDVHFSALGTSEFPQSSAPEPARVLFLTVGLGSVFLRRRR